MFQVNIAFHRAMSALITVDSLLWLLAIGTALALALLLYVQRVYQYWARRGVASLQPRFPLGNSITFLPNALILGTLSKRHYEQFRAEFGTRPKLGGIYLVTQPVLIVMDPDYIKDVLVKDFIHFVDRGFYYNAKDDPLSAHLFSVDGADWKNMRVKLTPTFTSGKMKIMFNSMLECANVMCTTIASQQRVEIKEVASCYSTDVIGACAFGVACNSFKYPDAEFRTMGRRIFDRELWHSFKLFFMSNLPTLSRQLGLCSTRRSVRDFFVPLVHNMVKVRHERSIQRKDFLQILMDMKNLRTDEMAAQVFLFFVAGFDTSSTTISFVLYELASHPECQQRLRDEVREVTARHNDEITYESLSEYKYLSQVIDETLRLYPSVPTVFRRCTQTYTFNKTDVTVEAGTMIWIPIMGLHRDPDYFPQPDNFDPDRFTDDRKQQRHPFVYLPFGDGPRNCIGLRFGLMQTKLAVINVIRQFRISVCPETKPIIFDPHVFLLRSMDPIYLRLERVDGN